MTRSPKNRNSKEDFRPDMKASTYQCPKVIKR